MYERALQGKEKTLRVEYTSTLDIVNNLGSLYRDQGKLEKAEEMYGRALQGYKKALGVDFETYIPACNTMWGIAVLAERQANLSKAKLFYSKALHGYTAVVGSGHSLTRQLQEKVLALDTGLEDIRTETEGPSVHELRDMSQPSSTQRPTKLRRYKLLDNLGFR